MTIQELQYRLAELGSMTKRGDLPVILVWGAIYDVVDVVLPHDRHAAALVVTPRWKYACECGLEVAAPSCRKCGAIVTEVLA